MLFRYLNCNYPAHSTHPLISLYHFFVCANSYKSDYPTEDLWLIEPVI